jgi:potassium-transporting ATPase KdpC subunit
MKTFIVSLKIFLFFTVLTGIIYPLFITGFAQVVFPSKANGSIIYKDGKAVGSSLIGQQFDSSIYFTSRPSVITYNPLPSGGSNYGLTSSKLKMLVVERKQRFIIFNTLDSLIEIPSEMLFASASGLDPHISPKAAMLQVNRIAKARDYSPSQKEQLIDLVNSKSEKLQFNILGEPRINVLALNLELDTLSKNSTSN